MSLDADKNSDHERTVVIPTYNIHAYNANELTPR